MSNEQQIQQPTEYVINADLLQQVLNILGEMPLKDSLQTYMSIQQGVRVLEPEKASAPDDENQSAQSARLTDAE